ncbi:MAG: spermidine/putrescine ABC transporter permease [Microbacterium sp.]|nr:MAG: spermidine/putrescine ABC transporter permease [Microbacterium sp.]
MNETRTDELAALRARAYGPHADIDADPVARARLRQLEDALRAAAAAEEAPGAEPVEAQASRPARPEPVAVEADRQAPAASADAEPAAAAAADIESPRSPGPRPIAWGWLAAWAASILVVAVGVGALVFSLASIRPVNPATGAVQIATLDEPYEGDRLDGFRSFTGVAFEDAYLFHGLVVVSSEHGIFSAGTDCLLVTEADDFAPNSNSFDGDIFSACGAGPFPATVSLVVDAGSGEELRAEFPLGTALQFVSDGKAVGVFRDDSGVPKSPQP